MKLTQWTDYSLRVLMYVAAHAGREAPVTSAEIAAAHDISHSHLSKIVMTLAGFGWLGTTRGRGGGLHLEIDPAALSVGEVVRRTESELTLVECFDPAHNRCRLAGRCRLEGALRQALARYLEVLDGVSLADLVGPPSAPGPSRPSPSPRAGDTTTGPATAVLSPRRLRAGLQRIKDRPRGNR